MAGIMLEKKRGAMTSMRHLPRGQLGDATKQQKKLLPRMNKVGVLGGKPIYR